MKQIADSRNSIPVAISSLGGLLSPRSSDQVQGREIKEALADRLAVKEQRELTNQGELVKRGCADPMFYHRRPALCYMMPRDA